jgi:protein disulfide-isomerase A6
MKMNNHMKLFVAVMLLIAVSGSMAESDVIELTSKNFDEIVFKSKVPVLLEFYAPWCGHCKNLAPTYEEVATNLKGVALVAKIDATVEEGLAHRYGIRGFPSLKLYKPGSKAKDMQDYQGARSAAALVNFVTSALSSNGILRLKDATKEALWTQKPVDVPRVILFTAKSEPSTLYKSLSMRFANQLVFAQVQQNDALCAAYGIETFPAILVLTSKDAEPIKFEGKHSAGSLLSFLSPLVQTTSDSETNAKAEGNTKTETAAPKTRPATPPVTWKEASDWNGLLDACGKHWCVILLNSQGSPLELKERMITHYGKEGKFQFVETQDSETSSKFSVDSSESQWVVFNAKKSKFAKAAFDGQLPSVLMDRIVSGDAKLTRLE